MLFHELTKCPFGDERFDLKMRLYTCEQKLKHILGDDDYVRHMEVQNLVPRP